MRTVTFLGLTLIATAINPQMDLESDSIVFLAIVLAAAIVTDAIDFLNKHK